MARPSSKTTTTARSRREVELPEQYSSSTRRRVQRDLDAVEERGGTVPGPRMEAEEYVPTVAINQATFYIIGRQPLIYNRMAAKAMRALLLPAPRKTKMELELAQKHDPLSEYRDSIHRRRDSTPGPTRLLLPAPSFKGSMATGALDAPGLKKTETGRRVWVEDTYVPVWGKPYLMMSAVRNSDRNRTPDIRTRAILPEWCSEITVSFIHPLVRLNQIMTLLAYGGITGGVGDFRQEKGKGNYGQYQFVDRDDPRFLKLVAEGGTETQDRALAEPECFDDLSEELLAWFNAEVARRAEAKSIAPARTRRTRSANETAEGTAE